MKVSVKGTTKKQKEYVKSLVKFCHKKLMPRMNDIEIDVVFRKYKKKDEDYGCCHAIDGPRPDRPRVFEIEVNSRMKLRTILETIAHEMVHVKQHAQSTLYYSPKRKQWRWEGSWLKKEPNYWEQPWEVEAWGRTTGLFVLWCQKEKLSKKKWTKAAE